MFTFTEYMTRTHKKDGGSSRLFPTWRLWDHAVPRASSCKSSTARLNAISEIQQLMH